MKTTALLTGRGNNTLKDKNVLDILGKPVLYRINIVVVMMKRF